MIPILYIEETRDDSTKDWHFCIRYAGNDTYLVYGYRFNYEYDFFTKMTFLDRSSLADFLTYSCCVSTSKMDVTLYFVDENLISADNFTTYYNLYNNNNELFSYNQATFTKESLMKQLKILRDMRM